MRLNRKLAEVASDVENGVRWQDPMLLDAAPQPHHREGPCVCRDAI